MCGRWRRRSLSKFWTAVLQAVVVALLLGIGSRVWSTYEEVLELRHDVDSLYAIVSDDIAKGD